MDVFEYKGRTKRGEIMTGIIESPSQDAVAEWLLTAGISPIAINIQQDSDQNRPAWLRALLEHDKLAARDRMQLLEWVAEDLNGRAPLAVTVAEPSIASQ